MWCYITPLVSPKDIAHHPKQCNNAGFHCWGLRLAFLNLTCCSSPKHGGRKTKRSMKTSASHKCFLLIWGWNVKRCLANFTDFVFTYIFVSCRVWWWVENTVMCTCYLLTRSNGWLNGWKMRIVKQNCTVRPELQCINWHPTGLRWCGLFG